MSLTVLVCGGRNWSDESKILTEFSFLTRSYSKITIVHGACRGADLMAEKVARSLNFETKAYPADWDKHGRAAGPIRNSQMLENEKIDYVLAFHSNIEESKGTKDMLNKVVKKNIPYKLII